MKVKIICLFLMFVLISNNSFAQDKELFKTGQEAEIILGPFANASAPKIFNLPSRVMTDGERLFVADPRNNRILIWNKIPENNKKRPDVVVGQPNFRSNLSGDGGDQLNFPLGVYSDGEHLIVADTYNDRVLIWNKIPETNGKSADIVLGQPKLDGLKGSGLNASAIRWPWDVCFDGKRLFVANTGVGRVSIWNGLPAKNNKAADLVLGKADFISKNSIDERANLVSPGTLSSDGTRLVVGDFQQQKVFIWRKPPSKNGQAADVIIDKEKFNTQWKGKLERLSARLWPLSLDNGQLAIVGDQIYIWDRIPQKDNGAYDRILNSINSLESGGVWGSYLFRRVLHPLGNY